MNTIIFYQSRRWKKRMITITQFKKSYSKAIREGYAAIFAGAGLSKASGFVDWKELLDDLAREINLDVAKESDLVEVAQYYVNEKNSRNEINEKIVNRFVTETQESENIRILSELPIHVFWTTNYDHLIEDTLRKCGKHVDVKMTPESLATNLSGNDAIVYKMHGDYIDPSSCVIIKDDYELYNDKRQLFSTTLQGDLVSKTFLFIGFSFEDPNLKYILSRIRVLLDKNRRTHYLFLKKIQKSNYIKRIEDYYYDLNKQELRIKDLKRYGIETILVDDYNQIPNILTEIKRSTKCKNIFMSGAAQEYGSAWEKTAPTFIRNLTSKLYHENYKIITGHARGVGSYIVSAAIEECQANVGELEKHLMIKAFPYQDKDRSNYKQLKKEYREGIFKNAGICIFMFGNKPSDNGNILASGIYEEYKMALQSGAYIIPLASTGYMTKKIWDEVYAKIEQFPYLQPFADTLQNCTEPDELINTILSILYIIQKDY